MQYFSKDCLERCRTMTPEQVVRFLEEFRLLQSRGGPAKSRLISMKVPEPMLEAFKTKARLSGVPCQTQLKRLMKDWRDESAAARPRSLIEKSGPRVW